MRPRYSFSSKHTRHTENIRKQRKEFPEIVDELIKNSDIILEILDSRFIEETRNIEIENKIIEEGKKIIFVLNKSDLINKEDVSKKELKEIKPHVFVSSKKRTGIGDLRSLIKIEARKTGKSTKGVEKINVGVIGYPNTGKSSLINYLIGKSSAGTASQAGFTKGIQKLKLTEDIALIDSPGVIPEKEYSPSDPAAISKHAKVGGRSYDKVKNPELVVHNLMEEYQKPIEKFYKIKSNGDTEKLLEELGKKRNILKKGGEIDEDKTARLIIKDWQEGKIKIN